ncbi:hypothetical protein FB451DRAFT_1411250 [Mycena latifolia]|nr:hypothetical protein FB451DRAFT_1411250 [Mycena latifolia]
MIPLAHFIPMHVDERHDDNGAALRAARRHARITGWAPQSAGALACACIKLFLLGLLERWVAACRTTLQAEWALRALRASPNPKSRFQAPPFMLPVPRGALYALQAVLGCSSSCIISIVADLCIGKMFFGRYASGVSSAH